MTDTEPSKKREIFRSKQAGKDNSSDKAEATTDNPKAKDPYPRTTFFERDSGEGGEGLELRAESIETLPRTNLFI
jgi:hypothetical protein